MLCQVFFKCAVCPDSYYFHVLSALTVLFLGTVYSDSYLYGVPSALILICMGYCLL